MILSEAKAKLLTILLGVSIAVNVGGGAAYAIVHAQRDAREAERDKAQGDLRECESNHATTTQSYEHLKTSIARQNAAIEERAKAYQQSRIDDARSVATADARARGDSPRMAALEAIAREAAKRPSGCNVPPVLLKNLEGL